MKTRAGTFALSVSLAAAASFFPAAARAQFEEPDTMKRFLVGPFVELTFRGSRGEQTDGTELGLGNGPALGARAEYWVGRTVSLGVSGSWARTEEKIEGSREVGSAAFFADMTLFQFMGEMLFRIKPQIPGYFMLGGGVRYVDPDEEDPNDPTTRRLTREDSYTEPMVAAGAGLEYGAGRRAAVRLDLRFYFSTPADLGPGISSKSISSDFVLSGVFLFRP